MSACKCCFLSVDRLPNLRHCDSTCFLPNVYLDISADLPAPWSCLSLTHPLTSGSCQPLISSVPRRMDIQLYLHHHHRCIHWCAFGMDPRYGSFGAVFSHLVVVAILDGCQCSGTLSRFVLHWFVSPLSSSSFLFHQLASPRSPPYQIFPSCITTAPPSLPVRTLLNSRPCHESSSQ